MIDENLKQWATPRQAEYIDAIIAFKGIRPAARKFGISHAALHRSLKAVKKKAALQGWSPEHDLTKTVPEPFVIRGTSTLYDENGKPKLQWVKTRLDDTLKAEALQEWVESLTAEVKGMSPDIPPPKHVNSDILAVYPIGDPHFGLYAWKDETGDDFDLTTAERLTTAAIDRLVSSAPPADTALIIELGDMFHTDNSNNQTIRSHNALDVDTRWAKVMQVGLRAMTYVVKKTLQKHKNVIVRIVKGNHDDHSSFALALALDAFFSNNKRVKIDLSPAEHWYYRFGKVLIGATHGDKAKMEKMPGIMACDRSEDWGKTNQRYWYQGHIHHQDKKEFPGCTVEAFRTLASKDAWHSGAGYRSGRDMCCIVHHKDYGEIERHRCDIGMIS